MTKSSAPKSASTPCTARLRVQGGSSGTRRIALRLQGEFAGAYQRAIALGGHVRWTDLRMSLGGFEEKRPGAGLVLSNWEI